MLGTHRRLIQEQQGRTIGDTACNRYLPRTGARRRGRGRMVVPSRGRGRFCSCLVEQACMLVESVCVFLVCALERPAAARRPTAPRAGGPADGLGFLLELEEKYRITDADTNSHLTTPHTQPSKTVPRSRPGTAPPPPHGGCGYPVPHAHALQEILGPGVLLRATQPSCGPRASCTVTQGCSHGGSISCVISTRIIIITP